MDGPSSYIDSLTEIPQNSRAHFVPRTRHHQFTLTEPIVGKTGRCGSTLETH